MADKGYPVYRVALCGKADVGKTSIFRCIRGEEFLDDTSKSPYLAEAEIKVKVNNTTIKMKLVDTAGMEREAPLTRYHYCGSHAILLVYDCDDRDSLIALQGFYKSAKDHAKGAAMVLVRNKIDKDPQCVHKEEADKLVYNPFVSRRCQCQFKIKVETSAKEKTGIKELFYRVADYLIKNVEPSNESTTKGFAHELKVQGVPPPGTKPESSGCRC